nr:DUF4395 family protein [Candidatus Paceibacterota bacterium]
PINALICFICLPFLLFESAFGICIGCVVYKKIYKNNTIELCAGNVCVTKEKEDIQKINRLQIIPVILIPLSIFILMHFNIIKKRNSYES